MHRNIAIVEVSILAFILFVACAPLPVTFSYEDTAPSSKCDLILGITKEVS
jgi:hypothetical protein